MSELKYCKENFTNKFTINDMKTLYYFLIDYNYNADAQTYTHRNNPDTIYRINDIIVTDNILRINLDPRTILPPDFNNSSSVNFIESLYWFGIKTSGLYGLSGLINLFTRLTELNLANSNIGFSGNLGDPSEDISNMYLKAFMQKLPSSIITLNFYNCKINDNALDIIISNLPQKTNRLILGQNNITDIGIIKLSDTLPDRITYLDINHMSSYTEKGAIIFGNKISQRKDLLLNTLIIDLTPIKTRIFYSAI